MSGADRGGPRFRMEDGAPQTPPGLAKPPTRSLGRRALRAVVAGALLLLVLVPLALALLVGTEAGTRWAIGRVLPGDVSIERVEGRLLGPLAIHGIRAATDGANVEVDALRLAWRPALLRRRRLEVEAIEIEGVRIQQKEVEPGEPEPLVLEEFRLPLAVDVGSIRISRLEFLPAGAEEPLRVDEVTAALTGRGSDLQVAELSVTAANYRLAARGGVVARDRFPLDLALDWGAWLPEQPALAGRGRLAGELLGELRLTHDLLEPTPGRLTARITDALSELAWCAEVSVPRFALAAVGEQYAGYEAGAEVTACGDATRATASGTFVGLLEELGEITGQLRLAYADGRVELDDLALHLPGGGRLAARGGVAFGGDQPAFDLTGRWDRLGWPLAGEPEFASPEGRFGVRGTPERFALELDAALAGPAAPAGLWRIEGRGTPSDFRIDQLTGRTLDGTIRGSGVVGWGDEVTWTLAASAAELNPGAFLPDLAGLLGLELTTRGTLRDGRLRADLQLGRLDGVLRDVPFALRTELGIDGEDYRVRRLELTSGSAALRAEGTAGAVWDLDWELDAPDLRDLDALAPGLAGRLAGTGRLSGPRDAPRIEATLAGAELSAEQGSVEEISARLAIDLSDRVPSSGEVRIRRLKAGETLVEAIDLSGEGTHADNRAWLAVAAPTDSLALELQGAVENREWAGTLAALEVGSDLAGAWVLRAPAPIRAGAAAASIGNLCIASGDAEACVTGTWSAEEGASGAFGLERLPLAMFEPFLPPDLTIDGYVRAEGRGEVAAGGDLRVESSLGIGPGALRFGPEAEGQPVRTFEGLLASVTMANGTIAGDLELDLGGAELVRGRVDVAAADVPEERTLRGHLGGTLRDAGLLGLLLDDVADTDGTLVLDVAAQGSLAEPRVTGSVVLERARADLLALGIGLRDVRLEASGDGSPQWALAGAATSGDGNLELAGVLLLPSVSGSDGEPAPWGAELSIRGERFLAFATPVARVIASPDLTVVARPDRVDVTGDVWIPFARITPEELEPVVPASPDVVVRGEEAGVPDAEPVIPVHSRVRVVLGDSVTLDGFGLRGRLAGTLQVGGDGSGLITGLGEIRIVDGQFQRFRQRLAIDRGTLVFAGGPVTNPGLDVRVTRRTRDVLAGMNVGGTATAPQVTLFSEPSMAEADVLAYLLLGRPASLASQAEGEFLQNAASSAGLAGGRMLAGRLGSTLGLQDARIEGENLEAASLFLGTNLTPRLYIGYGFGLFDGEQLIRLRYQLGRGWVVQSESGATSGADLLYTVER